MIIVEEVGKVVAKTATKLGKTITYMYGHPVEISQRLQALTDTPTNLEAFPLIVCFTDIPVDENQPLDFFGNARLQIIIANSTQQHLTAPERMELNFKPILYPMKKAFVEQMLHHKTFSYPGLPKYRGIDRFFWGKQGLYGNEGNVFNDYLDAIELQNFEVNIKNDSCFSTTKNF